MQAETEELDFDEEGRKLVGAVDASRDRSYHDLDAIWRDPATGGIIMVGNESAAQASPIAFRKLGITHVVNCTDDMPNFHEDASDPQAPKYFRFNVVMHSRHSSHVASFLTFVGSLFGFVDGALATGGNVLVHCLAGAHRAGTTGCLLLMYKEKLSAEDAIATAKIRRPVINPIGNLPVLLSRFEQLRRTDRWLTWAESARAKFEALATKIASSRTGQPPHDVVRGGDSEGAHRADHQSGRALLAQAWAEAETARQQQEARARRAAEGRAALKQAWDEAETARKEQEARAQARQQPAGQPVHVLDLLIEEMRSIGTRADMIYAELLAERPDTLPWRRGLVGSEPNAEEQEWLEQQLSDAEVLQQLDEEDRAEREAEAKARARKARADDAAGSMVQGDERVWAAERARMVEAAAEAEARMAEAEAAQSARKQLDEAVGASGGLLASSIASAMGVSPAQAADALRANGADLAKAMRALDASAGRHAPANPRRTSTKASGGAAARVPEAAAYTVDKAASAAAAAAEAAGDGRGVELAQKAKELAGLKRMAMDLSEMLQSLRTEQE